MLKTILAVGCVTVALCASAAQAQTMACTDADMTKMQGMVDKMADATQKDAANKEMMMAKDSMGKKDDKGCMDHMGNVEKMMPKQ